MNAAVRLERAAAEIPGTVLSPTRRCINNSSAYTRSSVLS